MICDKRIKDNISARHIEGKGKKDYYCVLIDFLNQQLNPDHSFISRNVESELSIVHYSQLLLKRHQVAFQIKLLRN